MKENLTYPTILSLPRANRTYMIDCDDRQYAVGALILQEQADDKPTDWDTIGYWSKKLSNEQRNYY